jgi:transposase
MVCCPSTRLWLRQHKCRRTEPAGRDGTAITAAAAVRSLSAATFCNAAAARGAIEEDVAMTIPPDLEAQILRYHHAERWRVGTIAKQLRVHRDTVARVLAQAGLPRIERLRRPSKIDPYLPFIHETLAKFPTLRASRLHAMVQERGYRGGQSQFRHIIACHRPRPSAEAYLRLRTLPGEQAQVDWGHFGHVVIGRARRPLMAFVAVLSFSRQIFLRFFLDARMENFLRGHVGAFAVWNAVPRVILYAKCRVGAPRRRHSLQSHLARLRWALPLRAATRRRRPW